MLSRIAIRGFKSFAEPATIDLVPGVNVIVGPNGSGKSNVVEAVLWALGEQRTSRLRAGAMGDVLFSGGGERKGAALAQVALTLGGEGDDEVETTRRLTADGESTYKVSGASCRLLDVQETLAARGLGPDALAIVRQGQVESVCAAKPADLRAIVDEAAGIAASKRRRQRAHRRLARMRERLARARDIRDELLAQARRLERQARAATRAAELDTAIAEARGAVAAARLEDARDEAWRAAATRTEAGAVTGQAAERLGAAERLAEASGADAAARAGEVEAALERARVLRAAAERVAGRADVVGERVAAARARADRARTARERLASSEVERSGAAAHLEEVAGEAERARAEAARLARQAEEAGAAATAAREAARATRARLAAAERELADLERRAEALAAERDRLEAAAPAGGAPDAGRAARREEVALGRVERWSEREREAVERVREARARADAAGAQAAELAAQADALAPSRRAEEGVLGAGLRVEGGYERAVAAALGVLADAEPRADLREALDALAGGAQAVAVPASPRRDDGAPGRSAWSVVRSCPEPHAALLERVLEACRIVDDLTEVPAGAEGTYVTREGVAFRGVEGIVAPAGEEWARRARHEGRAEEATIARAKADELAAAADALQARVGAVRDRRRAAERSAARASERLAAERAAAARAAADAAERATRLASVVAELERTEEARAAAAERAGAPAEPGDGAEELARVAEEVARAAAEARREAERTGTAELAARGALEEATTRLARLRGEAEGDEGVDPEAGEAAHAALTRTADALHDRARAAEAAVAGCRTALAAAREEASRLDGELARAREALAEARASAAGAEALAAAALERYAQAGGEPAGIGGSEAPARVHEPTAAIVSRLEELERQRAGVGAVNALAEEERAELTSRQEEIEEQVADLEAAETSLTARLDELESAVTASFEGTFQTLAAQFGEVVESLFPGGRGVLREVEDADGEPGITVEVVPAGKRPRPLALLSGGERSLVALAFCFALARTRPAPVYLLDEVEAALDDVNLRRFLALIRKLSGDTQFILVTHQQPTVEIADAIYGVTMRDGVSQLVSRRLDRDVAGTARPYVRRRLRAVAGGRRS